MLVVGGLAHPGVHLATPLAGRVLVHDPLGTVEIVLNVLRAEVADLEVSHMPDEGVQHLPVYAVGLFGLVLLPLRQVVVDDHGKLALTIHLRVVLHFQFTPRELFLVALFQTRVDTLQIE
jgi:hypothetical protein